MGLLLRHYSAFSETPKLDDGFNDAKLLVNLGAPVAGRTATGATDPGRPQWQALPVDKQATKSLGLQPAAGMTGHTSKIKGAADNQPAGVSRCILFWSTSSRMIIAYTLTGVGVL